MLERLPVHSSFFCNLCLTGVTFVWTVAHGHLLGLPVDLQVVLLELGEAQDDILLSQAGDCKRGVFRVVIKLENCIHNLRNGAHFVWSANYVVDCNGMDEFLSGEAVAFHIAPVHELTHGITVYKGWTGFDFSGICGLDSHFDDQGFGTWSGCNYIPLQETPLPGMKSEKLMWLDRCGCDFIQWLH